MFGLGRNEIMGLDIGSSAVKIVQLSRGQNEWVVTAAGSVDISDKGDDSPGRRETNVLRAILNCVRLTGVRTRFAVCGVGGQEVVVRNFDFPAVPADETERAIMLEARQVCPFNTDEIAIDYHLLGNGNGDGDGKTTGYLVVATDRLVKSKVRLAKRARIDCALMDIDGLALLNCFNEIEEARDNQRTAVLSVGSTHTTLAIEGKNGRPFIRNLNYAGESITRKIADRSNLDTEQVKAILSEGMQNADPDIRESFEEVCGRLVTDITKTFRYYGALDRSVDIQKIQVCGGFAMFANLAEFLNSKLPMEVTLWNPFDKIQCHAGRNHRGVLLKNVLHKNGPAMAVAAGLAMRSI